MDYDIYTRHNAVFTECCHFKLYLANYLDQKNTDVFNLKGFFLLVLVFFLATLCPIIGVRSAFPSHFVTLVCYVQTRQDIVLYICHRHFSTVVRLMT